MTEKINNDELLSTIKSASKECIDTFTELYDMMLQDEYFYAGNQWEKSDIAQVKANHGIAVTVNLIAKQVDALVGKRIQTLTDLKCYPLEVDDDYMASILSRCLKWVFDNCNAQAAITSAYKNQVINGLGYLHVYLDTDNDPTSPEIKISYESYRNVFVDPYCRSFLNLSDADYVIRYRQATKKQLKNLFPKFEAEIDELKEPSETIIKFNKVSSSQKNKVIVKEYWYRSSDTEIWVVNRNDETDAEVWKGNDESLQIFLNNYPDYLTVKKTAPTIRLAISANDTILLQDMEWSRDTDFPFIPLVGKYVPSLEDWKYKLTGIVRSLQDLQREYNARKSTLLAVTMNTLLSTTIMDKGAVDDVNELKRMGGKIGLIRKNPGKEIQFVPQQALPSAEVQLMQLFNNDINQVGLSPEVVGSPSQFDSAKAISLMQATGLTPVAEINEHLNFALRMLGEQILSLILQNFSDNKIQKIIGSSVQLDVNQLSAARNDIRYTVRVDETTNSVTSQYASYESLIQQVQCGVAVPPVSLIEQNPFLQPEIKQKMLEQYQQQQDQLMQQQQAQSLGAIQSNAALQPQGIPQ